MRIDRNVKKNNYETEKLFLKKWMVMGEEKQRIPPNQRVTSKFPVLHEGPVPEFDPKTWDFVVEGLVENPMRLTYEEFLKLPKVSEPPYLAGRGISKRSFSGKIMSFANSIMGFPFTSLGGQ